MNRGSSVRIQGPRLPAWLPFASFVALSATASVVTFLGWHRVHQTLSLTGDRNLDLGGHQCPDLLDPRLRATLAAASNRPDEEALWQAYLHDQEAREARRAKNFGESVQQDELQRIAKTRPHFLVEVRRTVLAVEEQLPLDFAVYGEMAGGQINPETGVPEVGRGCVSYPGGSMFAHDMARRATLQWYAARGVYAVNSTKRGQR